MRNFPYLFFLLLAAILSCISNASIATNRALLIGINNYIKPDTTKEHPALGRHSLPDLHGAENDVKAINQVLITGFGFQQSDIAILLNEQATRVQILAALQDMIDTCRKGDVFLFYFAGHGSQLNNRLSPEPDKMDECIVPADGIYSGRDIRDKEIATILQSFINKGVLVTAIFESCSSGSIARGLDIEIEAVPPSNETIEDQKRYPSPENNGALILSASQDFQSAVCRKFEDGNYMSVFTKAITEVMKGGNKNLSSEDLFNAILVQLKNMGRISQVPVMAANEKRRNEPLFGGAQSLNNSTRIIVEKVLPDKTVILFGGTVIGLEAGTELMNESKKIKLEVTGNPNLTSSTAKVIAGNPAELKAGSTFEISRYSYSIRNKLQVCLPVVNLKRNRFFQLKAQLDSLFAEKKLKVIDDITKPANYWLYYNASSWYLVTGKNERKLGAILNLDSLSAMLEPWKSIRLQLPLYSELFNKLKSIIDDRYSCVSISAMGSSDYFLAGTVLNNVLSYKITKSAFDTSSASEYPVQSDSIIIDSNQEQKASAKICEDLWKLSRIKSWLNLHSTTGDDLFPYDISLKNLATGQMIAGGTVKDGEQYQFYLIKNDSRIPPDSIKKRWTYIFSLSSDGSITLLFPLADRGGNIENYLPIDPKHETEEIFTDPIKVGEPFGIDHLICLTSAEPLPNPALVQQEGITARSVSENPLEALVNTMNARTRSATTVKAPEAWSIEKIRFQSVPK